MKDRRRNVILLMTVFHGSRLDVRITSEIVPKETIRVIIEESLKVLNCDRISLFVFDKRIEMLVLNASNLEHPIRVRPGQGIAGTVFTNVQSVNIAEAQRCNWCVGRRSCRKTRRPHLDAEGSQRSTHLGRFVRCRAQ
eukprot:g32693.t1